MHLGASGDLSDLQHVQHMMDQLMYGITSYFNLIRFRIEDFYTNDGHTLSPEHIYEYLSRVMYARRSKMNPLWNTFIVAGYRESRKYVSL
jgi:20S proteasome subunit beta 7